MPSITKRGKSFLIRVYAGYTPDGQQIVKTKTWRPPADLPESKAVKEAQRQAALFDEQIRNHISINKNIKFSEFAKLWIDCYASVNLKAKTLIRYQGLLKRIDAAIGGITLANLTPQHFVAFYAELSRSIPDNVSYTCIIDLKALLHQRRITQTALAKSSSVSVAVLYNITHGKNCSCQSAEAISKSLGIALKDLFVPSKSNPNLSTTTIRHYHRLITDILNTAVKWGYIQQNPAEYVSPPKVRKKEAKYLDQEQSRRLIQLLDKAPTVYRQAILLLLLTGMRRAELLGLEWQDINWKNQYIHIVRTSHYLPDRGIYSDTPKTEGSNRIIMIAGETMSVLRAQQEYQSKQLKVVSERVITNEDGSPMNPDRLTRWFSHFIRETDLPKVTLHSLRHTYATLLIENGTPITDVAAQLGHSSVSTTADIYAHSIRAYRIKAANKLGNMFSDLIIGDNASNQ